MGSLAIAVLQSTSILVKMKYCSALLVLAFATYVQAGQWVYVEDIEDHLRVRRSPQEDPRVRRSPQEDPLRYAPAPPAPVAYAEDQSLAGSTAYAKPHKGRVGPVYTFVKTDPKANFKWGVRHVAGVQYGK